MTRAEVADQWHGAQAGIAQRAVARSWESAVKIPVRTLVLVVYLALLLLPIYWMLNMSLRDNNDIMT